MKRRSEKINTKVLEDGRLAFLDDEGNITSVQAETKKNKKRIEQGLAPHPRPKWKSYWWRKNENGVLFVLPNAMTPADVKKLPDDLSYYDEFTEICHAVAAEVANGKTLSDLEKIPEMPPRAVIMHWAAKDEAFRQCLDQARRFRAEHYADKVAGIAETVDEDSSKSAKVKIDSWRWLAEIGDKERFSNQKVTEQASVVNIVFNTGITREEKPVTIEIKKDKLVEKKN